jgi:formylglycine-generating enzyme required for sulfatase activity
MTILIACLAPQAPQGEITIQGVVISNYHTGGSEKAVIVYAYGGTPEIAQQLDALMTRDFPERGLDADAARKLQRDFDSALRYFVAPGKAADELWEKVHWGSQTFALTGTVTEQDGRRILTVSRYEPTQITLPRKMTAPDRALRPITGKPLVLQIGPGIELKCIQVPAGRFMMGAPFYQHRRWQEDPPHIVTLTRSFYLSEHPITQEIYEAVTGTNPSRFRGARLPVHHIDCVDMYRFCNLLSAKIGRKVRIPTNAEWEYAARSGTSNPTVEMKYRDQDSNAEPGYSAKPLPVKSRKPNAWGFYDMHSGFWERVSDGTQAFDTNDVVDPDHTPAEDRAVPPTRAKHGHVGKGQYGYPISEMEFIDSEPGEYRFRIVVE